MKRAPVLRDRAPDVTWMFTVHGAGSPDGASKWAQGFLDQLAESGYPVLAATFVPAKPTGKRVVRRSL